MKKVDRSEFLALKEIPLQTKEVVIDGRVWLIKEMTEEEGTDYELSLQRKDGSFDIKKARRELVSRMLVDESGVRIVESESELKSLSRGLIGALFDECSKLTRYEQGEIETIVKKSEGAPESE